MFALNGRHRLGFRSARLRRRVEQPKCHRQRGRITTSAWGDRERSSNRRPFSGNRLSNRANQRRVITRLARDSAA
jgi:hypothetical protein